MARPLVVSADEHVVEPASFWNEWLPARLAPADRARAPRLDGVGLEVDGRTAPAFALFPELAAHSDLQPGASDVEGRLATLDHEGVDIAVLFPQRAMGMFGMADRQFMVTCFDAYNEWLADLCSRSDGRLYGVAVLPTVYDPATTATYIDRLVALGFHTFMLPGAPRGVSYGAPEMEPLWAAVEAAGLPLCFHISEAPDDNGPGGLGTYLAVSFQPFRKLWSYLVFSGILDRHPGLRIVFTEGGISWIPSALDHADQIHERFADHLDPQLPHPPSWYWHRQCYATFMDDRRGIEQIDHIGRDRVLWSRDYPHPEGTFGHTADLTAFLVGELGEEAAGAITGGTAAALFGLSRPARVAAGL